MPITRTAALTILPLFLGACCPSLWLTVTKGDTSPRPAMPKPLIADVPIPMPSHLVNRYDAVDWIIPSNAYSAYTDALDANMSRLADVSDVAIPRVRAAVNPAVPVGTAGTTGDPSGRDMFFKRYGDAWHHPASKMVGGVSTDTTVRATFVECGPSSSCQMLKVVGPLGISTPSVATIETCKGEALVRPIQSVTRCDKGPAAGSRPPACLGTPPQATYITLATPVTASPCDGVVSVTLSDTKDALAQTLFTFIHLSDIQIRDPDVRLGDVKLSHQLDPLIQSFEYDHDMEFYNRYVVEALLATINKDVALYDDDRDNPERPALVIHTGDAIDAGVTTELRDVHRLVDRLHIPFFDVIGNHDVLTFGNLLPIDTRDSDATCVTAESAAGAEYSAAKTPFVRRHVLTGKLCVDKYIRCPNCLPQEVALVAGATHAASRRTFTEGFLHRSPFTEPQLRDQPGAPLTCGDNDIRPSLAPQTHQHGFDLSPYPNEPAGYYAFQRLLPTLPDEITPRHLLFVALDTNDLNDHEGGSHGRIRTEQMAWLKRVLGCAAKDHSLVFVFGHHPISDIATDSASRETVQSTGQTSELEQVLSQSRSVVAYFYGHEHLHRICGDGRSTSCTHFWEIETGSVIEFPQEGRLVRLKYVGGGIAFLDLVAFKEHLTNAGDDFSQAVALARRGAQRDYCQDPTHHVTCTADKRVIRTDGRHTNGRLFFRLP
jgi:hypothetical protein